MKKKKKNWPLLIFSLAICQLAGLLGAVFNGSALETWYETLIKPSFNPPGWVFGPVWTILFLLMGFSLYLILQKGLKNKRVRMALFVFSCQWFLNVFWSFFFFTLQNPFLAFLEILLLLASILTTIYYFYKINKLSAYLLVPYLLWVVFATVLNYSIYRINL